MVCVVDEGVALGRGRDPVAEGDWRWKWVTEMKQVWWQCARCPLRKMSAEPDLEHDIFSACVPFSVWASKRRKLWRQSFAKEDKLWLSFWLVKSFIVGALCVVSVHELRTGWPDEFVKKIAQKCSTTQFGSKINRNFFCVEKSSPKIWTSLVICN
jgi:hypothetical protein